MKAKYTAPEMEIITFEIEDVITMIFFEHGRCRICHQRNICKNIC